MRLLYMSLNTYFEVDVEAEPQTYRLTNDTIIDIDIADNGLSVGKYIVPLGKTLTIKGNVNCSYIYYIIEGTLIVDEGGTLTTTYMVMNRGNVDVNKGGKLVVTATLTFGPESNLTVSGIANIFHIDTLGSNTITINENGKMEIEEIRTLIWTSVIPESIFDGESSPARYICKGSFICNKKLTFNYMKLGLFFSTTAFSYLLLRKYMKK